jgi:hypothetical protein
MYSIYKQSEVDGNDPTYKAFLQSLYSSIFKPYMVRYVGQPPSPERDWPDSLFSATAVTAKC